MVAALDALVVETELLEEAKHSTEQAMRHQTMSTV